MVATTGFPLGGVILKSGVYDFVEWSQERPWYDGIKLTMLWEIGWLTQEKLKERSAIYYADKIKAPVLVIHGSLDDRAPMSIVENFVKTINEVGGSAQLIKVESEHVIPMPKVTGLMEEFMRAH
ncbi:MAG TPA: prolyl oligopeptidase family serine peptidase [Bdellovibrionales bacterium]|nr:prolyl oligopeptidase family serine peptidase [Bdellovibrionales bacterium]